MNEDDVIREIRATREAFAASHGYDVRAMVAELRRLGAASGHEIVRFSARWPVPLSPQPAPVPAVKTAVHLADGRD